MGIKSLSGGHSIYNRISRLLFGNDKNERIARGNLLTKSYFFDFKDRVSRDNLLNNIIIIEHHQPDEQTLEKVGEKDNVNPR